MFISVATTSLILSASHTNATILVKKNFRDLVTNADAIVVGTISNFEAKKLANKNIYTRITLENLEIINGRSNRKKLNLQFLGGSLETGETHYIVGAPKFSIGERVILFIRGNGKNMIPIVGMSQGVFRIQKDKDTGKDLIKTSAGFIVNGIYNDEIYSVPSSEDIKITGLEKRAFGGYTEEGEEVQEVANSEPAGTMNREDLGMPVELFIESINSLITETKKNNLDLVSVDNLHLPSSSDDGLDAPPPHEWLKGNSDIKADTNDNTESYLK